MPILIFLGLSVLDLGPMYATDRRQTRASSLNGQYPRGGGIISCVHFCLMCNRPMHGPYAGIHVQLFVNTVFGRLLLFLTLSARVH